MNDAQLQGRRAPVTHPARGTSQTPETAGFFERAA
jgi:hypothetical protein